MEQGKPGQPSVARNSPSLARVPTLDGTASSLLVKI